MTTPTTFPTVCTTSIPPGSILSYALRPPSPSDVSDFPTSTYARDDLEHLQDNFTDASITPQAFSTIIRIATQPRVFGIHSDSGLSVRVRKLLMDGGVNICLTGDLSSLVGIVDIPPMPITVAVSGSDTTANDCCTKHGFIPLVCTDGSVYWQLCFYFLLCQRCRNHYFPTGDPGFERRFSLLDTNGLQGRQRGLNSIRQCRRTTHNASFVGLLRRPLLLHY